MMLITRITIIIGTFFFLSQRIDLVCLSYNIHMHIQSEPALLLRILPLPIALAGGGSSLSVFTFSTFQWSVSYSLS